MEKRVKTTLNRVLLGYLALTGGLCAALLAVWVVGFALLVNSGLVLPASAGAEGAAAATPVLLNSNADAFDAAAIPYPTRYALFAAPDLQTVLATNMDARHLEKAQGGGGIFGYTQYQTTVPLVDGSVCLLQYDYAVAYRIPALQARLPDFQLCYFALLALLACLIVFAASRRTARLLRRDAAALGAAGAQIAAGELSGPAFGHAEIKEFDAALAALETLRGDLSASLQTQWAAEQQRTEQISALAHDLKTPLTIISGNAELLGEEALTPAQKQSVDAILRGAEGAQQYLAALRSAATGGNEEEKTPLSADFWPGFLSARAATGRALCAPGGKRFTLQDELPAGFAPAIRVQTQRLARAVDNLLDNAARHTPAGGSVRLTCRVQGKYLCFAVADTGPGFRPEALKKAGRLLYTGDAARPADGHQGLGLYFARTVALAHGGELTLQNTATGALAVLSIGL